MDLIFKRYSSPFLLVDEMIINCQLDVFIVEILEKNLDEKRYELWMHRVFNKSYQEWYDENFGKDVAQEKVDVENIIKDSMDVLNVIQPKGE